MSRFLRLRGCWNLEEQPFNLDFTKVPGAANSRAFYYFSVHVYRSRHLVAISRLRFGLLGGCSAAATRISRLIEHVLQGADGYAQQASNSHGREFAACGGHVGCVAAQSEISPAGLWHAHSQRLFFVHPL